MKNLFLIFFLLSSIRGITCSCGRWGGDFFDMVKDAQLVVIATVKKHSLTGKSMRISIHDTFSGKSVSRLLVFGDNGIQCRPYVSIFSLEKTYYFAIQKSKRNEYSLTSCGESFLLAEDNVVKSFSHYTFNRKRVGEMNKDEFEMKLKQVLAN